MNRLPPAVAIVVLIAAAFGVAAGGPPASAANAPAAFSVEVRLCPEGYAGRSLDRDCTGTFATDYAVTVKRANTGETLLDDARPDLVRVEAEFELEMRATISVRIAMAAVDPLDIRCNGMAGRVRVGDVERGAGWFLFEIDLAPSDRMSCSAFLDGAANEDYALGADVVDQSPFSFGVYALACETDPGRYGERDSLFPPAGCVLEPGIGLSLEDLDGDLAGACVTGANGFCRIAADFGRDYLLRLDPATLPEGYAALAAVRVFEVTANGAGLVIVPEGAIPHPAHSASVTYHPRLCPADYAGSAWYVDCHGTLPARPVVVGLFAGAIRAGEMDDEGSAAMADLQPGSWWFFLAVPDDIGSLSFFCSRADAPGVEYVSGTSLVWFNGVGGEIELEPDGRYVCDLYEIPWRWTSER